MKCVALLENPSNILYIARTMVHQNLHVHSS